MSRHAWCALSLAIALLPVDGLAGVLSLERAQALAVQRSDAARAARAGVASAMELARSAGQLPDPLLRAGIENLPISGADRFNTARDTQTMRRIGISQEWLDRDKRAARQALADAATGREALQVQMAAADARLQTALAYLDAYFAGETLKLSMATAHHVQEELEAARARLASSTASSAEVLALTGARGEADDETAEVSQQQRAAQVMLERWVGLAADELSPASTLPTPSEAAWVAGVPAVVALQRDIEVARLASSASAAERRPNWTWELSYGQRAGYPDMVSFGVSIPLQVAPAQRQDRDTAARQALVDKAEAELSEAIRAATAEFRALASAAGQLQDRLDRFHHGVTLPAQQRTAAALAAYRSNQAPLASLFEARHQEVVVQRKALNLQRELARIRAQLAFTPIQTGATP